MKKLVLGLGLVAACLSGSLTDASATVFVKHNSKAILTDSTPSQATYWDRVRGQSDDTQIVYTTGHRYSNAHLASMSDEARMRYCRHHGITYRDGYRHTGRSWSEVVSDMDNRLFNNDRTVVRSRTYTSNDSIIR
ncbi:MAG: hypothetical protein SGI71_13580 [Verrucomicrobiota bacterium]|nr:hypothetical protein [Verrucomicrobiota bacterium]